MERDRAPTDAELRLLKVLWARGPSTARAVLEALDDGRRVGYTTVLKTLQVMEEKGLVTVDRSSRSHVYAARIARAATLRGLLNSFVDRTFDGAAEELLVHLISDTELLPDALRLLEERVDRLRRREAKP